MDFNELFARHQVALIDMAHSASPGGRAWAEECADYYADRIITARAAVAEDDRGHFALKEILRG